VDFLIQIARSGVIAPMPAVWWMKIVVRSQKVNGSPAAAPPGTPLRLPLPRWFSKSPNRAAVPSPPGYSTADLAGKMAPRKK
jgi:hypothetical protein